MVKNNRNSKNLQNTRVKLLGENTASKIAAGEVIESPLSIVKELIENSLDANSSIINISIENGGINKISVIDDGDGIHPNDLELIFQRFEILFKRYTCHLKICIISIKYCFHNINRSTT